VPRHAARRDSSGWVDVVVVDGLVVVGSEEERRVSKRPGAEGAPWFAAAVVVVLVGCEAGGAMRRDCEREARDVSLWSLGEDEWGSGSLPF
jgi:hypothetical protein